MPLEEQVLQATLVPQVLSGWLALQDPKVALVPLAAPVCLERQDLPAERAAQVPQDLRGELDQLAKQDLKDLQDPQDLQDLKDLRDPQEIQVHKEPQVKQDLKEALVAQDLQDLRVTQVRCTRQLLSRPISRLLAWDIMTPRRFPMMKSSNGNIFRVTGPLCGEFTGDRWIPLTKASDAELWCFRWSAPE